MKIPRQQQILSALERGKYMISPDEGTVHSRRYKNAGKFRIIMPTIMLCGSLQYKIYTGTNGYLQIYAHHLIYLAVKGLFPESDDIIHLDGDRSNNAIENLFKRENFIGEPKEKTKGEIRVIRKSEIAKIRYMVELGETNCAKIARDMGLNRLSVRRTIMKIKNNQKLKYE